MPAGSLGAAVRWARVDACEGKGYPRATVSATLRRSAQQDAA